VFWVDKLREASGQFPALERFFRDNPTLFSSACTNLKHGYILLAVKSGVTIPASLPKPADSPPPSPPEKESFCV